MSSRATKLCGRPGQAHLFSPLAARRPVRRAQKIEFVPFCRRLRRLRAPHRSHPASRAESALTPLETYTAPRGCGLVVTIASPAFDHHPFSTYPNIRQGWYPVHPGTAFRQHQHAQHPPFEVVIHSISTDKPSHQHRPTDGSSQRQNISIGDTASRSHETVPDTEAEYVGGNSA